MITVYALKSERRSYIYVGMTSDLSRRFDEHNAGKAVSTRAYGPFKLIFTESYPDRASARKREVYLKSGVGKEFLKKL